MSDELMDGRNLRNRRPTPTEEQTDDSPEGDAAAAPPAPPPANDKPRKKSRLQKALEGSPFAYDPPTHPYVVLEPPGEAGDVIRQQMADVTREMPPVPEDSAEAPAAPSPEPTAAPEVSAPPRAEGDSDRIMKLPRVKVEAEHEEEEEPAPSTDRPARPEYVPHFHTPTVELPPVPDLGNARPEPEPTPPTPRGALPDYAPHFHTPTGELPPVRNHLHEADEQTPDTLPPAEAPPAPDPVIESPKLKIGGKMRPMTPAEGMRRPALPDQAGQYPAYGEIDEETGEIIDADWVLEVGSRMRPPRAKSADEPSSIYIVVKKSGKWLLPVLGVAALLMLIVFVPRAIPGGIGLGGGDDEDEPGETTRTPVAIVEPVTPTIMLPSSTPLPPTAQGKIAFVTSSGGDFEIAVLEMVTGKQTYLSANTDADRSPAWSPDGRRIVFVSDRGGTDDIWVMNADGSGPLQITTSQHDDHFPAWSPDGATIIFSREAATGSNLMAVETACLAQPATCEGLVRSITTQRYDRYPAWAPGGGRIAFAAGILAGEPTSIALMDIDGSNYEALPGTGSSDTSPSWAPDGLRIAFASYALGDQDLWLMSYNGDNLVQLTSGTANDVGPSWSPDGQFIVFASDRGEGGSFDLYVIRTNCAAPEDGCEDDLMHLTTDVANELDAVWTP